MKKYFIAFLLFWFSGSATWASHIFGGDFEMTFMSVGRYNLRLNLFIDDIGASQGAKDRLKDYVTVSIFRKRDNVRMESFRLYPEPQTFITYSNSACAPSNTVRTAKYSFSSEVALNPSTYTDQGGYYVAWQDCCRNYVTVNIVSSTSSSTGMTFYLEFPALKDAQGNSFTNSSPVFSFPNGELICANTPFSFSFSASDADGDRLEYALVTPYTSSSGSQAVKDTPPSAKPTGSAEYPYVRWQSGYDLTNVIPGNPPLRIDPNTGDLTVNASQVGNVFALAVEVREYRNGQLLGLTRRDYQFTVIACAPPPPKPDIYKQGTPAAKRSTTKTINVCQEGYTILETQYDPAYNYQWQRDGKNIANSNQNTIKVSDGGIYTVVISNNQQCSKDSPSDEITVNVLPGDKVDVTSSVPFPTCADKVVTLDVTNLSHLSYQWFKNGDSLRGETKTKLIVKDSGKYKAVAISKKDSCIYEPEKDVIINQLPESVITNAKGLTTICDNDTLPLKGSTGTGYVYEWRRNGVAIPQATSSTFTPKQSGDYSLYITDDNKCTKLSSTLKINVNPTPVVALDSIKPFCGSQTARITLNGTPLGGKYTGQGIVNATQFDPVIAGFGRHQITYAVTNSFQCTAKVARWIAVDPAPRVSLGGDLTITRGDTVTLNPQVATGANATYQWSPPGGLSSAIVKNPIASPLNTTTYFLQATLPNGCIAKDDIIINVLPSLSIPTGITPNGDGVNDRWEIDGIIEMPNCEVEIFNRWGEKIFGSIGYNTPFDGTVNGQNLPVATYYYIIKPNNGGSTRKGYLTIIR
ncbi:MAG: gliding motility-associated C-terminal domain-containing protein [Spirosomataceae bacterium]